MLVEKFLQKRLIICICSSPIQQMTFTCLINLLISSLIKVLTLEFFINYINGGDHHGPTFWLFVSTRIYTSQAVKSLVVNLQPNIIAKVKLKIKSLIVISKVVSRVFFFDKW